MKIYTNTVSRLLWSVLNQLMKLEELNSFRLVGGTSLSLVLGHRISIDIDMFTDAEYGSIDFHLIDNMFLRHFPHVEIGYGGNNSMGKSYFIGNNKNDAIKLDLFYTETFQFSILKHENIRLSKLQTIAAMKLEVIGNSGRKKDFWDLHELMKHYSISEMLKFYTNRNPYGYSKKELIEKLIDFDGADTDFDPICLKNKHWELIKLDFEEAIDKELN